jgi:CubicO group peptidase (beta-lactamase class C family)
LGCLWLATASFAQAQVRNDNPLVSTRDKAVDAAARRFFSDPCHVGLSIAVVSGTEPHFYNYGSTTRGGERTPTRDSIYEIASVTKTFTGALAAKAVVESRMELDADFRAYLDGPFPYLEGARQPVTLRMLATHTSGLPRDIPDSDALLDKPDFRTLPVRFRAMQRGYGRTRYLDALRRTPLRADPGGSEAYSNVGMMLIAFGLEHIYGQPFEQLMRREILVPLGMASTGFSVSRSMRVRLVRGYDRLGRPAPALPTAEYAAWGLYSDPEDMARFVAWQLDSTSRVIAQAHAAIDVEVGADPDKRKGLIWNIGIEDGAPMLWHGGGSFGTTSQVVLFPSSREGYALMANDACGQTEDELKKIAVELHIGR